MVPPLPSTRCPDDVDENVPLNPGWERDGAVVNVRLRDLIADLDTIGSLAVPYARLPRKCGAYAAEFRCWAALADETPQTLLARPKLGAAAVRALIETGRDAVRINRDAVAAGRVGVDAAITRMLGQLDDYDRTILLAQVLTIDPVSQRQVAEQLGVHQASVRRNLSRARARLAELLADPAHREVVEHADELRRRLGPYLPADVAYVELRRFGVDPAARPTADTLLYLAGPYARVDRWLESTVVPGGGAAQAEAAVAAVFSAEAAPTTDALLHALTTLGLPAGVALTYLEGLALRRFGDRWVRWSDDTSGNRIEAVLQVLGAPATAEAILETIGPAGGSVDNINRVLILQDRFVRATRRTWGLRAWGIHEYVSVAHAIGERIDAAGGEAVVTDLTAELLTTYPDISESSIRTTIGALVFVTKDGRVRRRTNADGWPPVPPLRAIRGAFHNGDNEIRVALPVTSEMLRGSGQALHKAVAAAASVAPGQQRTFTSPRGEVTLTWSLSSTHGTNLGSLRALARAVGATIGDTVVVALRTDESTVEVTRLAPADAGLPRLRKLLGRTVRKPVAGLSAALRCRPQDVDAVLRARGDDAVADMLASLASAEFES